MKRDPGSPIDWERIETDYRVGLKSLREMAAEHGITHGAIRKKAEKFNWARDLKTKIQAKADALVAAAVSASVSAETALSERQTVDDNARAIVEVRLGHRVDISKGRGVVRKLLAELEGVTDRPDLIEDLQQALFQAESGGEDGDEIDRQAAKGRAQRLRDALDRVVSMQGRVASVKGLAEAMKNLIGLERQAWGMEDEGTGGGTYEEFLQSLNS